VILHLRDDDKEFLEPATLRQLVRKYSDHLSIPIVLKTGDTERDRQPGQGVLDAPKPELSDEEYQAFYKHIAHDSEDARAWRTTRSKGNIEYTSLLYLPSARLSIYSSASRRAAFNSTSSACSSWTKRRNCCRVVALHARAGRHGRPAAERIARAAPEQSHRREDQVGAGQAHAGLARGPGGEQPEEYAEFWKSFGVVLKEGIIEDPGQKERIAKLLRFHSTAAAGDVPEVTLEQYVSRMKIRPEDHYYLTADTLAAARNSPHLEGFRAKGMEVLLLIDRIDEWVAGHLHEFDGKTLANVASSAADVASAIETPEKAAAESAFKDTAERLGKILSGKIASARVSARLTDSPAFWSRENSA